MANTVDQDQVCSGSTLFPSILNLSLILGNYLQQTTSADDMFRCIFFLGALRVKLSITFRQTDNKTEKLLQSVLFSILRLTFKRKNRDGNSLGLTQARIAMNFTCYPL